MISHHKHYNLIFTFIIQFREMIQSEDYFRFRPSGDGQSYLCYLGRGHLELVWECL